MLLHVTASAFIDTRRLLVKAAASLSFSCLYFSLGSWVGGIGEEASASKAKPHMGIFHSVTFLYHFGLEQFRTLIFMYTYIHYLAIPFQRSMNAKQIKYNDCHVPDRVRARARARFNIHNWELSHLVE